MKSPSCEITSAMMAKSADVSDKVDENANPMGPSKTAPKMKVQKQKRVGCARANT